MLLRALLTKPEVMRHQVPACVTLAKSEDPGALFIKIIWLNLLQGQTLYLNLPQHLNSRNKTDAGFLEMYTNTLAYLPHGFNEEKGFVTILANALAGKTLA